ncbi:MAG TPA: hypothetical protein RMH99_26790 [Sandaracinaceae bacterium LLY-WYZ-13_1]|nr:hypothetical protein [Sandaracinaceae bacterium LLY-WYZ-13_1]
MSGRRRKTSSFIFSEVMAGLRRLEPEEAMVLAAQRVLGDCLSVREGERVLVVFERDLEELAAALLMVSDELGARVDAIQVDASTPESSLVDRLRRRLEAVDVSVLLAGFAFPRAVRRTLTENVDRRRHAHMLGLTDAVIRQSLRVDYVDVDRLGRRLRSAMPLRATIAIESPAGSDVRVRTDPRCAWVNQGGLQHGPGWTNLPAGELATCPASVDGVFVPDGGVWLTDGTALDRVAVRRLALHFEGGVLTRAEGPADVKAALFEHLDAGREGRRVGQISFGTNVGVIAPIGVLTQDVKLPGVHLILGYSAPELTGAAWNGDLLVHLLQRSATARVGDREVLGRGRYAADLAG